MKPRLWWSPDPEGGVAAWVSLYDIDVRDCEPPRAGQPVVDRPRGHHLDGATVEVLGEPRDGAIVMIRSGDVLLQAGGQLREGCDPPWP